MVVGSRTSKKLKYCVIECIKKDGKSNKIERGMYKGFKESLEVKTHKGDEVGTKSTTGFLYIASNTKSTKTINLDFYNVLMIEVFDGANKTYTFFMYNESEQKMALGIVKEIHTVFKDFVNSADEDMIDVEKYTDVPKDLGGTGAVIKTSASYSSCGAAPFTGGVAHQDYYHSNQYTTRYVKKEPVPSFDKRIGRRPTKKALDLMASKIDQIAKGEYKGKLPRTVEDETEKKDESTPMEQDEEYTGYVGYRCC